MDAPFTRRRILRRHRSWRSVCAWAVVLPLLAQRGSPLAQQPLQVAFGVSRPPFVLTGKLGGISVDLFREATRRMGLDFAASHYPNRRLQVALEQAEFDAVVEVQPGTANVYYSTPFVTYSNVVLSRVQDKLTFKDWTDLSGRSVCAWQGAKEQLGTKFESAQKSFGLYQEFGVQRDQVRLWLLGRCDVLVIDRNLVFWHMADLARKFPELTIPKESALAMAPVPGKSSLDWYVGFRDEGLRNRFDQALAAMRKDGSYKRIFDTAMRSAPMD